MKLQSLITSADWTPAFCSVIAALNRNTNSQKKITHHFHICPWCDPHMFIQWKCCCLYWKVWNLQRGLNAEEYKKKTSVREPRGARTIKLHTRTKVCLLTSAWWKKSPGINFGVQLGRRGQEWSGGEEARWRGMGRRWRHGDGFKESVHYWNVQYPV